MGTIPGYGITVLRNGQDVSDTVVSGSLTLEKDKLSRSWELEFAEPMDVSAADTWTIKRKIAGYETAWCEDAVAANVTGEDAVDTASGNVLALRSTRRVRGDAASDEVNDLLNYCLPKTLVFVNQDWLLDLVPGATVQNGILVYPVNALGIAGGRIYHPRLPGKEFENDSFECVLGVQTHHDIARYLARLVGLDLMVNTPDVTLIDTMTIQSGTTWLAAIESIFKTLWQPTIEISGNTIYVNDVCKDDATINPIQTINLTNAAIQSASLSHAFAGRSESVIDHVIVTGRRTQDTVELLPEEPDYTPIEIPEVALEADTTLEASRTFRAATAYKQMGEYSGQFGLPGEQISPKGMKKEVRTINLAKIEQEGRRRYVPIDEEIKYYDSDDTLVAKTTLNHYYSKGLIPLRTVEKQYVYCNMPGEESKDLHLLSTKTTLQRQVIKPLNLTLTEELFEGLVLYETVTVDGTPHKVDPMVLAEVLRGDTTGDMIDTSPDTAQATLEMTLSERSTSISRTDDDILIKHELTHDKLTGITRTNSQILENPLRDRNRLKADHVFRKEYFDGAGRMIGGFGPCYHVPVQTHHDDICTDALADRVAQRAFARKNTNGTNNPAWDIRLPFPLPIDNLAVSVVLPDFQARVNGELVTVSGGEFVLIKVTESFACSGKGNVVNLDAETVLSVWLKI